MNWILSGSWSRHKAIFSKLLLEPAWSLQVHLHWASPHLPWMQRICRRLFFRIYLCLSRDFVNQHSLCSSIYIETALNSREECMEFAELLFWRLSLCLSRDSLSRDTPSLDLCILFKFIPLIHSAPILCFWHILLYTNFFPCILPREIFFLSLMTLLLEILISAVKGLIWTIFFFLTFIVLIQWNFPWSISASLLIFTHKASSHVVIV